MSESRTTSSVEIRKRTLSPPGSVGKTKSADMPASAVRANDKSKPL